MMNDKRVSKLARENNCIDLPAPHRVEVYRTQVAFGYIVSREERKGYKGPSDRFGAARKTVEKLAGLLFSDKACYALMF